MPNKLSYDEVYKSFEQKGCILLSKTYQNTKSKLTYKCTCGHERISSYDVFMRLTDYKCNDCKSSNLTRESRIKNVKKDKENFQKLVKLMETKIKETHKYRQDFLPENYNKILICRVCKEEKNFRLFQYRKNLVNSKENICKMCSREATRTYREFHTEDQHINNLLSIARRRQTNNIDKRSEFINNDITKDFILIKLKEQSYKCIYTGIKMDFTYNSINKISIDRIDSSIGYIKSNIQLVCWKVNQAKNSLSHNDFINLIHSIKNKHTEGTIETNKKKINLFLSYIFKSCKSSKVNKEYEFKLTKTDILDKLEMQKYRCAYTNKPLEFEKYSENKLSIDRIDSNKGYRKDNIQLVIWRANQAKNNLSDEEFINMIDKISQMHL